MDPNKCYKAHIVQKSFQTNLMYNNRYVSYIHTHTTIVFNQMTILLYHLIGLVEIQ